MKKILIITCVFPPEPVVSANLSLDIATALTENYFEVTVLSPNPTRPLGFDFQQDNDKQYSFKHIVVDSFTFPESKIIGRMKESYSLGKAFAKHIKKNHHSIDIIYQNTWPLFSQLFVINEAKKYNIPVITHVQDIYPESLTNKLPSFISDIAYKLLLPIDKKILSNSKKVICISEKMKKQLSVSRNIEGDRFAIVTNWQNEEDFIYYKSNVNDVGSHTFTFMYLGNNGPVAGVEFLIESFSKANIQNSKLIIAGSGSKTSDCKKLAEKLGLKSVEFLPVPDGKVPEIQDLADVMLLPVKKNGAYSSIPSKLPAYMFSRKAILGSLDIDSDTAKAIIEANSGIVVDPEDQPKLITAMREMASWSSEKLIEKGDNAFNYAMKNFSKKEGLRKIINIIKSNFYDCSEKSN